MKAKFALCAFVLAVNGLAMSDRAVAADYDPCHANPFIRIGLTADGKMHGRYVTVEDIKKLRRIIGASSRKTFTLTAAVTPERPPKMRKNLQ